MDKSVEIKKVVIRIGSLEIELKLEEVQELAKILGETFGEKETIYIPTPYPIYTNPPHYWTYWTTGTNTGGIYTINCNSGSY